MGQAFLIPAPTFANSPDLSEDETARIVASRDGLAKLKRLKEAKSPATEEQRL